MEYSMCATVCSGIVLFMAKYKQKCMKDFTGMCFSLQCVCGVLFILQLELGKCLFGFQLCVIAFFI